MPGKGRTSFMVLTACGIGAAAIVYFMEPLGLDYKMAANPAPIVVELEKDTPASLGALRSDSVIENDTLLPLQQVVKAGRGDTLMDLLLKAGVDSGDAHSAITALREVYNPRSLRAGQDITVTFERGQDGLGAGAFHGLSLTSEPGRQVAALRDADGFAAQAITRETVTQPMKFAATINSSLFEAATKAGVPAQSVVEMIRAMSYDVDFQRDIQQGDSFELLMERQVDKKGQLVKNGDVTFASLTLSGTKIALYRYEDGSGIVDFYNPKGESAKKALLRTPVDGARLTSGYGLRRHPILGYNKMHKGIDFGAPTGTPIMAAGNGVVEKAGWNGGYGKYVRIRHNNDYSTAYAHMSRFAKSIRPGSRVKQGQIVGYVGTTGRSTGAHLHYEVLVDNRQVNPLSIKVPTGTTLAGRELKSFQTAMRQTDTMLAQLPVARKVASLALTGATRKN